MTYTEVVEKVKEMFGNADVSNIREHLAYQFNITGEGAGAFYVEVKDGKLNIQPYTYNDRDAAFTCSADLLFKLASGKADPVASVLTGKLKVEGSIDKAMRIKTFLAAHRG